MSVRTAAHAALGAAAMTTPGGRPAIPTFMRRATWGSTAEELGLHQLMGAAAYLEYHLDHTAIDDSILDAILADPLNLYNTLTLEPHQFDWLDERVIATLSDDEVRGTVH